MTRRDFLELGTLAAAGFALAPILGQDKPEDVVIVGAGIAGLSAWEALKKEGVDALIIEASARVGGRIQTSREIIDGKPVELGANWIHGAQNNPLWTRVTERGLATTLVREETEVVYDFNGEELTVAAHANKDRQFADLLVFLEKRRGQMAGDRPLQDLVEEFIAARKLNARERRRLAHSVEVSISHDYAESLKRLSGKNWNVDEGFQGGDASINIGLDAVLPRGYRVRMNQKVQKLEAQNDLVVITTDRDTFRAKAVICTVPLSVLKSEHIEFVPSLEDSRKAAIGRLGFGKLEKIVLAFPRRFWPADTDLFGMMGEEKTWSEWFDCSATLGVPSLMGFTASDKAEVLARMGEKEAVASALQELAVVFGEVPEPDVAHITNWTKNPLYQGAYTTYLVGSGPQDVLELAKPHAKRILFAGEATAAKAVGTIHGAATSGNRAAEEAITLL